jgi:hypothetical protein
MRLAERLTEPAATNALGEYKLWLHVFGYDHHNKQEIFPGTYPWPFESKTIDAELLASWGALGKFRNFPGNWPLFVEHWSKYQLLPLNPWQTTSTLYWLLANGPGKQHTTKFGLKLTDPMFMRPYEVPEVFLKCICSK